MHNQKHASYAQEKSQVVYETEGLQTFQNYKRMKARVQRAERQAYWNYLDNMLDFGDQDTEDQSGKMKRFWSFVGSLRKDSSGVAPLKDQGQMHADPVDKSNILNTQRRTKMLILQSYKDNRIMTCLISQSARKGS